MTTLRALWLPIVLSSVFVFLASTLIHMAMQWWHKSDYGNLRDEDKVMDALRPFGLPPGDYTVPNCSSSAEMRTSEFRDKLQKGPVIMLTVMPNGMINMGKSLTLWFLYLVAVGFFAAYISCHALSAGATHRSICRFAGVTSFLGYSAAIWQMSIWYRRSWLTTIKVTIDGLIYAAITAGTFAWLWPR
jgi:hypothetical protein